MTEEQAKTEPETPLALVVPEYLGPATRGLTTALLYKGSLMVPMPAFLTEAPLHCFYEVGQRAHETDHRLGPLLSSAYHYHELVQKHALDEREALRPLRRWITTPLTVYPGTVEAYESWDSVRDACMPIILRALSDRPSWCGVASMELIWRLWELALSGGADPEALEGFDADTLLATLDARAESVGGPAHLFGECALNRYTMIRATTEQARSALHFVATSSDVLDVLTKLGQHAEAPPGVPPDAVLEGMVSFFIFDRMLSKHTRPLHASYVPKLASLLEQREGALIRMRAECASEARAFVRDRPASGQFAAAVDGALSRLEDAAAEIVDLDRKTMKSFVRDLATDPRVWGTVAGFLGAGGLPAALTAALGITALSLLGSKAAKARYDREEQLEDSPWAFLYYAHRESKP